MKVMKNPNKRTIKKTDDMIAMIILTRTRRLSCPELMEIFNCKNSRYIRDAIHLLKGFWGPPRVTLEEVKDNYYGRSIRRPLPRGCVKLRKLLIQDKGERCKICETSYKLELHHEDGDPRNNRRDNLNFYCPNHHPHVKIDNDGGNLTFRIFGIHSPNSDDNLYENLDTYIKEVVSMSADAKNLIIQKYSLLISDIEKL